MSRLTEIRMSEPGVEVRSSFQGGKCEGSQLEETVGGVEGLMAATPSLASDNDDHSWHVDNGATNHQRLTILYTPEQKGCGERKKRTLVETARSIMHAHGNMPQVLWPEMVNAIPYILN
ncbi:hypothetical protein PR048_021006 [Dryococelus australis]|uniref:Uncharacterized protein n=1 Tax=Dryococelus australis TaxID=614101 RepID=A0ABQ9GX44_9NEOP|nr:hypothetical protein PR048_021006 [Dryococelus australis]